MASPNVILLTLDALRSDRLGCYGSDRPLTPNLDRLAQKGIRFDQAITGGSWTQAAFPVLLTSTYASMYGGCLGPLARDRPSPVEALAAHGYATGCFSTNPLLSRAYGYQRGFQRFVDLEPDERDPFLRNIRGGQRLLRYPLTHYLSSLFGMSTRPARAYVPATELNQAVLRWFREVQRPFFAWAHYMDVHWPYHLEEALIHPRDIAQAWQDLGNMYETKKKVKHMSPTLQDHYIQLYERAVQYTDSQVGRLLADLGRLGLADNTVVMVVSDHGEEFGERGRWGHLEVNLHDEIIKVPLIIYLPGRAGGQVVERQVRLLDIMPTVMELCDCPPPQNIKGTSLAPFWNGDESRYDQEIAISERWRDQGDVNHIISIRTESFKFIWDNRFPDQSKLFDLKYDPAEKQNVADRNQEVVESFQEHLNAHLQRVTQTTSKTALEAPKLDENMQVRFRDLGYLE